MYEIVKFHKKYYTPIHDGYKTQTMRTARKRLDVQDGDIIKAVFPGIESALLLRVTSVTYKQFKSINLDDAINEGLQSVDELKNELLKIYPNVNKWDRFYLYKFYLKGKEHKDGKYEWYTL